MTINIRAKGQNGEREIADMMNLVVMRVMKDLGHSEADVLAVANTVQRNQNQSAVGGNDLSNTFGLSIEVKRQEDLSINAWWKQCAEAAARNGELPVLAYRQNRKPWRMRLPVALPLPNNAQLGQGYQAVIGEINESDFKLWLYHWIRAKISSGEAPRK